MRDPSTPFLFLDALSVDLALLFILFFVLFDLSNGWLSFFWLLEFLSSLTLSCADEIFRLGFTENNVGVGTRCLKEI